MVTTVNSYKGKGIFHTIGSIVEKQYGFDEQGFNAFHKGKESDYQLLERYLVQIKGLKAKRGQYGIDVHLRKGGSKEVCILTYCEEGHLVFTSNSNAINKELESIITEFTSNEWAIEVDGSDIEQLIAKHFSLSNYIKQYKTYTWVELMVKVVEQRDFYEEFIQGMDQFSKLGLLWNYTTTGLVISYEDDKFTIDDSLILLQQDRLQIMGDFFTFITLIKSKYYQEDSGELLATSDTTEEQGERLTESRLDELQAEQESQYLANLKEGTKTTLSEPVNLLQGSHYLDKLKANLSVGLIVYKDGDEIVNTYKQIKWDKDAIRYNKALIQAVKQANEKYGFTKLDMVFSKDLDEVKLRIQPDRQEEQNLVIVKGNETNTELDKLTINPESDIVSQVLNWFEATQGW